MLSLPSFTHWNLPSLIHFLDFGGGRRVFVELAFGTDNGRYHFPLLGTSSTISKFLGLSPMRDRKSNYACCLKHIDRSGSNY